MSRVFIPQGLSGSRRFKRRTCRSHLGPLHRDRKAGRREDRQEDDGPRPERRRLVRIIMQSAGNGIRQGRQAEHTGNAALKARSKPIGKIMQANIYKPATAGRLGWAPSLRRRRTVVTGVWITAPSGAADQSGTGASPPFRRSPIEGGTHAPIWRLQLYVLESSREGGGIDFLKRSTPRTSISIRRSSRTAVRSARCSPPAARAYEAADPFFGGEKVWRTSPTGWRGPLRQLRHLHQRGGPCRHCATPAVTQGRRSTRCCRRSRPESAHRSSDCGDGGGHRPLFPAAALAAAKFPAVRLPGGNMVRARRGIGRYYDVQWLAVLARGPRADRPVHGLSHRVVPLDVIPSPGRA